MVAENILWKKGKHHQTYHLRDKGQLKVYLSNQLQINDLNLFIEASEDDNASRAEFVKITTDSKKSKERAFKGFLVNSYTPLKAELNAQKFVINPMDGSFVFVYDFETFKIAEDITIVGVENSRNFRHIREQAYLFKGINPLFVSRYPQNQNKDFIKWLTLIPNNYLHFGDFDMAGIRIYMTEYKKHLPERVKFFIPKDIEMTIEDHGSRERYDNQKFILDKSRIKEKQLLDLIKIIHSKKKGLDQEYYINPLLT
ncbi:FIG00898752: hypothetical protein [hydrothermal vent metagenome]|uniref:DUF7281 domain-containing protein n=1 Tax=hydrothermal vent metagenome TaxID=652676 RepID=A0A1W1E0L8_9ZZZZ